MNEYTSTYLKIFKIFVDPFTEYLIPCSLTFHSRVPMILNKCASTIKHEHNSRAINSRAIGIKYQKYMGN